MHEIEFLQRRAANTARAGPEAVPPEPMPSALQRGAAIAAAGGGRPSARTQEPARARSSNESEAQAIRDAKQQEALRWQLGGVTAELEEARRELSKLQTALTAASEARARLAIQQDVALEQLAEDVHAAAEEAHREQQHRIVHAEAEEAHRQQQLRRNQH